MVSAFEAGVDLARSQMAKRSIPSITASKRGEWNRSKECSAPGSRR